MKRILTWLGGAFLLLVGFLAYRNMTKYDKRARVLSYQAQHKAAEATSEALREAKALKRKAEEAKEAAKTATVIMRNRREQLKEQGNENMASKLDRLNKL